MSVTVYVPNDSTAIGVGANATAQAISRIAAERGIDLRFAELKGSVHEQVDRYSLLHGAMPDHTARTTGEAVKAYLRESGVPWTDWEDAAQSVNRPAETRPGEAGG